MAASQIETDISGRLLELAGALYDEPGFTDVVASLKSDERMTTPL